MYINLGSVYFMSFCISPFIVYSMFGNDLRAPINSRDALSLEIESRALLVTCSFFFLITFFKRLIKTNVCYFLSGNDQFNTHTLFPLHT